MANRPRKTKDTDKRSNKSSESLPGGISKWGFCPICHQSVKRQGVRLKNGKRVNVIATHWGGQEMCYGSDMLWEYGPPVSKSHTVSTINNKKPDHYKTTIEEIPCNNTL